MTKKFLDWLERYNLLLFNEIDSTNLEAKRLISSGIKDDFVLVAAKQLHGRGRSNKSWVSEPGNLYLSLVLRPYAKKENFTQLSFVTSLALYDCFALLARESGHAIDLKLKWPNDILVNNLKLSGILLESYINPDKNPVDSQELHQQSNYVIIGVGVNVLSCPNLEEYGAGCLNDLLNMKLDVNKVLDSFMSFFHIYYRRWQMDGFMKLRKLWLARAYKIGEVITIADGMLRASGTFKDISMHGSIRIKLASGQIAILHEGSFLR